MLNNFYFILKNNEPLTNHQFDNKCMKFVYATYTHTHTQVFKSLQTSAGKCIPV